jgi:hypothetical protein
VPPLPAKLNRHDDSLVGFVVGRSHEPPHPSPCPLPFEGRGCRVGALSQVRKCSSASLPFSRSSASVRDQTAALSRRTPHSLPAPKQFFFPPPNFLWGEDRPTMGTPGDFSGTGGAGGLRGSPHRYFRGQTAGADREKLSNRRGNN